jgi:folate-binding protein YgfZ
MVTANVRDLRAGTLAPSFLLNHKGQILASFEVLCESGDSFLLLFDELQRESLGPHLKRFIIREAVALTDETDASASVAVRGRRAREVLVDCGLSAPPSNAFHFQERSEFSRVAVISRVIGGIETFEIAVNPTSALHLWTRLCRLASPLGSEAQERDRVLSGQPLFGTDIRSTDLPQETEQLEALDFTKGCYVGQEIVERIRSRGNVHRKFTGLIFGRPVTPGSPVTLNGAQIGEITSAAPFHNGTWAALGFLKRQEAASGTEVTAGGVEGRVTDLPFGSEMLSR